MDATVVVIEEFLESCVAMLSSFLLSDVRNRGHL
jgi:hypothetical protein